MDPNNLTSEQAYKIGRHYLGEKLVSVIPCGNGAFGWVMCGPDGEKDGDYAENKSELVGQFESTAAQLRLEGWTPTHERLEWEPNGNRLFLLTGRARFPVATYLPYQPSVLIHEIPSRPWHQTKTVAEMVEHIAGWVENNLPYYLPPFPGELHVS